MKLLGAFLHPVKGMRAVEVPALQLDAHGVVGDRRWLVVDETGRFLTQRVHPALATFTPRLEGDALWLEHGGETHAVAPGSAARQVTIWSSTLEALDCGDGVARWLSERLAARVRLVAFGPTSRREVKVTRGAGALTTFTDGFPLLITNEASLDALNATLAAPIPMARFRPNLVVRAATPWEEDGWARLRIDGLDLDGDHPCGRCVVITTDQRTGERPDGSRPLTALTRLHDAHFGLNLVHRGQGTLQVGAEVEVVSR